MYNHPFHYGLAKTQYFSQTENLLSITGTILWPNKPITKGLLATAADDGFGQFAKLHSDFGVTCFLEIDYNYATKVEPLTVSKIDIAIDRRERSLKSGKMKNFCSLTMTNVENQIQLTAKSLFISDPKNCREPMPIVSIDKDGKFEIKRRSESISKLPVPHPEMFTIGGKCIVWKDGVGPKLKNTCYVHGGVIAWAMINSIKENCKTIYINYKKPIELGTSSQIQWEKGAEENVMTFQITKEKVVQCEGSVSQ